MFEFRLIRIRLLRLRLCILVVEDERIVARSLRKQLLGLGYDVTGCVSSGAEAIQKTEDDPADLVLMDINLEGPMDGVEAAGIIRAVPHPGGLPYGLFQHRDS